VPPVDRKNPIRSKSSDSTYSLMEFVREFPDDDACLEHLWRTRYSADGEHAHCPKCDQERVFKRYATGQRRQSWTCNGCGHHLHPTAGTIFHKSSTSLQLWYYAMYLMASTRCGVSAKHLERELGVTYKTAWRMFNRIRNVLMADEDDTPLTGIVEVDETSIEGKPRVRQGRSEAARYRERSRATVFAAVERKGRIRATVLESRRGPALKEQVIEWVAPAAIIMTDEWPAYSGLGQHFADHSRVRHSAREYAFGSTNTNTVEGFFGNLKTGIRGNYKKVSRRWLQGYLNEYCWRYNRRRGVGERAMFRELVARAASV